VATGPGLRPYDPHARWADRQQGVVRAWRLAARVGGAILGTLFAVRMVYRTAAPPGSASQLLFLALVALQLLLIVIWVWATEGELRLLAEWLDPVDYEVPSGDGQMWQSIAIAVFLVLMLVATPYPVWYGIAFFVYSAVSLAANRYFNGQLLKAVNGSRAHLVQDTSLSTAAKRRYSDAIDLIDAYFLRRSHQRRHAAHLVGGLIGLGLALASLKNDARRLREWAYLVYIVNVAVNEGLLIWWRHVRSRRLDAVAVRRVGSSTS
jgi:hypothetical protein